MISFARGVPAPECLPVDDLADCARVALERDGKTILSYGASSGYGPLREWLAARHEVDPARIFITNGSLQGFVFLAQRLISPLPRARGYGSWASPATLGHGVKHVQQVPR